MDVSLSNRIPPLTSGRFVIVLFLMILSLHVPTMAQEVPATDTTSCDSLLRHAEDLYRIVHLEEALATLEQCRTVSGAQHIRFSRLKARIYLSMAKRNPGEAADSLMEAAREAVRSLLTEHPHYRSDPKTDILDYTMLVDSVREELASNAYRKNDDLRQEADSSRDSWWNRNWKKAAVAGGAGAGFVAWIILCPDDSKTPEGSFPDPPARPAGVQ